MTQSIVNNGISPGGGVDRTLTKTFAINPPLPSGVSVTFNIIETNNFITSPNNTEYTNSTTNTLSKNISIVTPNSIVPMTFTQPSPQTCPGTQYTTNTKTYWNSITLTQGDTLVLVTNQIVDRVGYTTSCGNASIQDTVNINSASISGCDCCDVVIGTPQL